ncbi:MAG: FapA family protein, partial [Oscillospiraceae bacterium]|nr:FapA family protein [Oscillospiraceae bacterium]
MAKNAYFQLSIRSDGVYIVLHPPADGGAKLLLSEIKDYLARLGIGDATGNALGDALDFQVAKQEIKVSSRTVPPVGEDVFVSVSDDKMQAHARCYAASDEGRRMSRDDFLKKLSQAGVRYGVKDDVIDEWLRDRRYCTTLTVAQGVPAEKSRDASIEYLFNRSKEFKPTMDEKGIIDFHHLNLIVHVSEGDVLAVLTPAYDGAPGTDVCGEVIPSAEPVRLKFDAVQNAEISEDGCRLISKVNGHVETLNDKIILNNLYVIKGDVGSGTGDVEYNGSVKVTGDVREGFFIKASGDVYVDGVVEAAN